MPLKDNKFPLRINSSANNPTEDFFVPAFKNSVSYDVAVGYFTSNWIRDAAEGIAHFAENGGRARWVVSPELDENDWAVISKASESSSIDVNSIIENRIEELINLLRTDTREVLCWLVKEKIMEFRVAIPSNKLSGIFHAKTGIFTDEESSSVVFSGSYNHTGGANTNWEIIDIYCEWNDPRRVKIAMEEFEKVWNRRDPNLEIHIPSEILIKKISAKAKNSTPYEIIRRNKPKLPDSINLRKYQIAAIKKWFLQNGRGMYVMATGTGKTVTALSTIIQLVAKAEEERSTLFVLIVVPFKHLLDQWVSEGYNFGLNFIRCLGDSKHWSPKLLGAVNSLNTSNAEHVFAISTNASFKLKKMQAIIQNIKSNFLFVADEAHNLNSVRYQECLPNNARFRLGLTATPDNPHDVGETNALVDYFGEYAIEFNIRDAIKNGYLCKYYYYPVICNLSDEEMDQYKFYSLQIARELEKSGESTVSDNLMYLLLRRAAVLSLIQEKLVKLENLLCENFPSKYNLIYCGAASDENFERHINKVMSIAGNEIGMKIAKFTADESLRDRNKILSTFERGELDAIAAIKCLDEGVDVPRTETAYILASSTNPRQFIQRRGRVLRKAKGKEYANIYDFIAVPELSNYSSPTEFNTERRMLRSELLRVNEFAMTSENSAHANSILLPLKKEYNLLDI